MTEYIVMSRNHCQPNQSRGWQCISRGYDKYMLFTLLYWMFPSVNLPVQNYLLPFRVFKLYFDSENC